MYDVLDQKLIAMDYYEKALKIARETGLKDEIAANLANIAQLRTIQGFYEEAIQYMEEALRIDRETGDHASIAVDLNTIGRIYESWGMYDQAVRYLEEALEIDRRLGQDDKVAIRLNSLGLVYKSWKKYDKALEHFNQALLIDQNLGRDEKVALRQANIGSTYLEMGETDKAISFLEQSLEYFRENNLPSYIATTLNDLGRCYLAQNNIQKAEKCFKESAEICRQNNFIRFLMNSLDQLSELYSSSGRYREAFVVLKEYTVLNDSIFDAESQRKVAEFNARYELDKKQQENEILRRDNELAIKRHLVMNLSYSLGGLFLLVILLTVLVRLKSARNRKLIAEKENEKLKMDLEQRNKELTYNAMCIIKNNETVAKIAETLEDALQSGQNGNGINNMVRRLQHLEREKNWTEFEVRFTQVHEEFYKKLNARFPDLTPNEKKLCAFLKLNMSTKDIAAITHQSVHSINVARTRMRKKLGIDGTEENLIGFLHSL
jgi:tetratricopeptide (TPR) repeat protein